MEDQNKGIIKEKSWPDSQVTKDKPEDLGFVKEKALSEKPMDKAEDVGFMGEKSHEERFWAEKADDRHDRSISNKVLEKAKNLGNTIYETILGKDEDRDIVRERSLSEKPMGKVDKIRDKAEDLGMVPIKPRRQENPTENDFYTKNPREYEVTERHFIEKPLFESGDLVNEESLMDERSKRMVEIGFDDFPGSLTTDRPFKEKPKLFDSGDFMKEYRPVSFMKEDRPVSDMSERARAMVEIGFDDVPGSLTAKDW